MYLKSQTTTAVSGRWKEEEEDDDCNERICKLPSPSPCWRSVGSCHHNDPMIDCANIDCIVSSRTAAMVSPDTNALSGAAAAAAAADEFDVVPALALSQPRYQY